MSEELTKNAFTGGSLSPARYRFLEDEQIAMIDEALASLGEFGEVRLVVEKGRLRFLITQQSFDALKWQPGVLNAAAGGNQGNGSR